jgi:hypothetical protein
MKKLLRSLDAACILVETNAVGASDRQTLNTAGNGPSLLSQETGPKEAKGSTTAKVNVDIEGVILKATMRSPTSNTENRSKGIPKSRAAIRARHTYLPRRWEGLQ